MLISNILLFQIIKTILKPEICTQPILQTGIKDNIKSLNKISIIPNRKTWIEFIIDFKDNNTLLDYYLSISSTDNKFLSLVSYDYIFLNGVITFTNKVIDTNFSFIRQKNYYVFQEKSNKNKQVVSMFSFIEFFDFSFYNYIYQKENKAWKFIILLNNKNNEIIEL